MENGILFFTSFSAQRRELRKIWNETNSDWQSFLKNSDNYLKQAINLIK